MSDLISRDEKYKVLIQLHFDSINCDNKEKRKLYNTAIKLIESIPSAEPKTGHWIEHPEIKTITPEIMFYECSECGDKQCFCKSDIHKKHFCNYCGAKMIEPQERSDKE